MTYSPAFLAAAATLLLLALAALVAGGPLGWAVAPFVLPAVGWAALHRRRTG